MSMVHALGPKLARISSRELGNNAGKGGIII